MTYSRQPQEPEQTYILPAEHFGEAESVDGHINIGGVLVPIRDTSIYVRRRSSDLSIIEVHMATHDGLAQEELDAQNRQAAMYPLGPKEYWRGVMVGKYTTGADGHVMTDEDFEAEWSDE